jgi:hypothetical protein
MTRTEWAKKNKEWTQQKERRPVAPDAHLFHEGAMKDLHTELAEKYRELAPSIEKYKDSFLAGQLYDALEAIAIEHGAELEFKRMMTGARNRAHMDYDTNPGGFQNWFWYLPFADEDITEENQDDRNARIIAGEIEDAMSQGNEQLVKQKIKELIRIGYILDKDGKLQRMGMYEQDVAEGWFTKDYKSLDQQKFNSKIFSQGFVKNFEKLSQTYDLGQIAKAYIFLNSRGSPSDAKANHTWTDHVILHDWMMNAFDIIEKKYPDKNPTDPELSNEVYEIVGRMIKKAISKMPPPPISFDDKGDIKLDEKQDACYHKVKSRYKVWPSAYASGALVQCRKKGAANWGNKSKK